MKINLYKKYSYFNGNDSYGEEYYPFNQFMPDGVVQDYDINLDRYENKQRDGQEFDEFEEFKKQDKVKKLLKLRKKNKEKKDVFEPHPFYETLYGTPADFSGLYTSPLEYYSGSIIDGPDAITNPYNNSYQLANDRSERMIIRGMIFKDLIDRSK